MPFQAKCLFCGQGVKAPDHALGASVRCRRCANYFTLAPAEDAILESTRGPGCRPARVKPAVPVSSPASAELQPAAELAPNARPLPGSSLSAGDMPDCPATPLRWTDRPVYDTIPAAMLGLLANRNDGQVLPEF